MALTEQGLSPEQVAAAEFGRSVHTAIEDLATNLLRTPEFTEAVGRAFFRRQMFHSSRNEIDSVVFNKGDFTYLARWNSTRFEPGAHSKSRTRDLVRSGLTIIKYDPAWQTEDGWSKKVAEADLSSDFLEGKGDENFKITGGSASLSEDYDLETSWESPKSWRTARPQRTTEGQVAIDKLPEVFAELYPTPVQL